MSTPFLYPGSIRFKKWVVQSDVQKSGKKFIIIELRRIRKIPTYLSTNRINDSITPSYNVFQKPLILIV